MTGEFIACFGLKPLWLRHGSNAPAEQAGVSYDQVLEWRRSYGFESKVKQLEISRRNSPLCSTEKLVENRVYPHFSALFAVDQRRL